MVYNWQRVDTLKPRSYICGYCGNPIASEKGYFAVNNSTGQQIFIYVCHYCDKATFFDVEGKQTPGFAYGGAVNHIDDAGIENLYEEARKCFSLSSFTAVVLCCRKILMHIAVAKGAPENQNFVSYVEYLSDKNYIPPDAKGWVDYIREKGNEANHEIKIMAEEEAKDLISFIQMLLKIIYEFPANSKKPVSKENNEAGSC
ncbi:MAG: DUF4145 domain-containing protein [Candidatus Nealsonbacteria bacterium]|nr:DUF4145 domain-containing protein [Candidatus Nealsonbacteria bacterium]